MSIYHRLLHVNAIAEIIHSRVKNRSQRHTPFITQLIFIVHPLNIKVHSKCLPYLLFLDAFRDSRQKSHSVYVLENAIQ